MKPKVSVFALALLSIGFAACNPKADPAGMRRPDASLPAGGAPGEAGALGNGGTGRPDPGRIEPVADASSADRSPVSETDAGPDRERQPAADRDTTPSPVADAAPPRPDAPGVGVTDGPSVVAYNVYLGQTHAHSDLSRATHDEFPGMDLPAVGFAKAKAKGADFYFITDHVDGSGSITPKDFQTIKAAALAATDASFVAGAGIEYHLDVNEVNLFGTDYDAAHGTSRRSSPQYLDYLMNKPGAFVQWNHPVRSGEAEQKFDGHSPARDRVAALVEVLNGSDSPAAASYQKALDLGWHVGPAAGHDNHGDSWFELPTRTGVLATSLTPDEIYEAIRQQRVFCSQDPALKIWYDVNGSIMGTTIAAAVGYTATVKTQGGGRITKIEIVAKGGTVVATGIPTAGPWTQVIAAQPGNFYYARLTGTGNVRAWTAPVWIGTR